MQVANSSILDRARAIYREANPARRGHPDPFCETEEAMMRAWEEERDGIISAIEAMTARINALAIQLHRHDTRHDPE